MAVYTLRPKKKGKPQSNVPALEPPNVEKTKSDWLLNSESAFATVKLIFVLVPDEKVVAERLVEDAGQ